MKKFNYLLAVICGLISLLFLFTGQPLTESSDALIAIFVGLLCVIFLLFAIVYDLREKISQIMENSPANVQARIADAYRDCTFDPDNYKQFYKHTTI